MALIPVANYAADDDDEPLVNVSSLVPYQELPVYGVPPPDRKWTIDRIVNELDNGQFTNAAPLADAMMRDSRIVGALEQRNAALFGKELNLEPADDSTLAVEVRDAVEDNWEKMFPRHVLEEISQYAILLGIGFAQKVWDLDDGLMFPTLSPFHSKFATWRWDLGAYMMITLDRSIVIIPEQSQSWITYCPYGFRRAFLRGRLRALVGPWLARQWTLNDFSHWCEIHGHPLIQAIVPQAANPKQEADYVRQLSKMGSNTVVKSRQDKDGNKYDVKYIEAMSDGWKGFEGLIAERNKEISQVLLGQSMSTDGMAGLGAQENPGEGVSEKVLASDNAKLCEMLFSQVLREFAEVNYGNPDLAPRPCYAVEPPEDEGKLATLHFQQAQADNIYIMAGVLTPEEVAISRFGGGEYSMETEIDADSRKRILDASIKEMEQKADNDLQAALDPAATPGTAQQQQQDMIAAQPVPPVPAKKPVKKAAKKKAPK